MDKKEAFKDLANTPEAIRKREERRKKRESQQQKTVVNDSSTPHLSSSDKERESIKERIENVTNRMRKDRKKFLTNQLKDWKMTDDNLRTEVLFLAAPYSFWYDQYPIQMSEFLSEAIKYPDDEIRHICCDLFTRVQRTNTLNTFLWKIIFSADFVPKAARDFFLKNQESFRENNLLWSLSQKAKSKFAGNEDRMSPETIKREEIKADIEKLYHDLRHQRKTYFNTLERESLIISADLLDKISTFCDMKYYQAFPIQVANLIYEGSKYPDERVSQIALTLWEESLAQGVSDPFLWAKMLLSDMVIDEVWRYLFTYFSVLKNQKEDLYFYIRLKTTSGRNRSAVLDELYNKVCQLYQPTLH